MRISSLLLIIIVYSSCSKEEALSPVQSNRTICLLDTIISPIQSQYIQTFKRDSQGRIDTIESDAQAGLSHVVTRFYYNANDDKPYRTFSSNTGIDWQGEHITTTTYFYNNSLLERTIDTVFPPMWPTWGEVFETIYEHDAKGRIIRRTKSKTASGGVLGLIEDRFFEYDKNDNLISESDAPLQSDSLNLLIEYFYDDKHNPFLDLQLPELPMSLNVPSFVSCRNNIIERRVVSVENGVRKGHTSEVFHLTYNEFDYPETYEHPIANVPREFKYDCTQ